MQIGGSARGYQAIFVPSADLGSPGYDGRLAVYLFIAALEVNVLNCRRQVAGSCGAAFTRVGVEPLEFIGIDGTQHPRREYALKQAADPARTVPGAGDLHERGRALRGDREGGDRAGPVSDSVRTRPGSGSAIFVRYARVRPPAVSLYRRIVPAPTPPDSTRKSENAGGRNRG